MRSLHRQKGISPIGWIALLIVVGFASIVAIRIVPAYLDYYAVLSATKSVHTEGALSGASADELREKLGVQLRINDVDDLGDVVSIRRSSGKIVMIIDYEVREHLIGNMDVVLRFNRSIGS